jgi:hypothetical protein
MDNLTLRGSRPRELPRPNRTYGTDRVCAHEGCETRLSRYNKARHCFAHAPLRYPLVRGERKKRSAA